MQFRGAAGDVDRWDVARFEKSQTRLDDVRRHHLGAIGTCIDVAVATGLVAALADVDLQN